MVHVDHLNRPIRMTNSAKASVWDAVWLPWGGAHAITGTAALDARFPGQWFQLESGLHYNWHRHYDPTIGRYTQPDPLGFVDGPSVYGYVDGDPVAQVDPSGENAAAAGAAAAATLLVARWCLKNPKKCKEQGTKAMCAGIKASKPTFCHMPGCRNWPRSRFGPMSSALAGAAMRSAEACLALRDAEVQFCDLTGTTDHAKVRPDLIRKIDTCQQACGWNRWYPF